MQEQTKFYLHPIDLSMPPFNVRLHLLFPPPSIESGLSCLDVSQALQCALTGPVRLAFPAAFGRLGHNRLYTNISSTNDPGYTYEYMEAPYITSKIVHQSKYSYNFGALPLGLVPNLHLLGVRLVHLGDDHLYLAFAVNHFIADFDAMQVLLRYTCMCTSAILYGHEVYPTSESILPLPKNSFNRNITHLFGETDDNSDRTGIAALKHYRRGRYLDEFIVPESAPPLATNVTLTFDAEALSQLKIKASSSNNRKIERGITSSDAVTALLWRTTSRAKLRESLLGEDVDPTIKLAIAINLRRSTVSRIIQQEFWGNLVREGVLALPASQVCDPNGLNFVAQSIRACIEEARSKRSIHHMLHWFDDCIRKYKQIPEISLDPVNGFDHATSNWAGYDMLQDGYFDLRLGSKRGPISLDTGGFFIPRGVSVMMKGEENTLIVKLGLREAEAQILALDEELQKYAQVEID